MTLISPEIAAVLKTHGMPTEPHVVVYGCDAVLPLLDSLLAPTERIVATSLAEVVRAVRAHRVAAVLAGGEVASSIARGLQQENVVVAVVAIDTRGLGNNTAMLRASGVMDVATEITESAVVPVLRRALDHSGLLTLELAHRCESRRLLNRELGLLGQPPESMSDDLGVCQPPPLPTGPLSVYNLEEASEAFETAYIERVQQLSASAREAASYLGVSSATLSRRTRREAMIDDS